MQYPTGPLDRAAAPNRSTGGRPIAATPFRTLASYGAKTSSFRVPNQSPLDRGTSRHQNGAAEVTKARTSRVAPFRFIWSDRLVELDCDASGYPEDLALSPSWHSPLQGSPQTELHTESPLRAIVVSPVGRAPEAMALLPRWSGSCSVPPRETLGLPGGEGQDGYAAWYPHVAPRLCDGAAARAAPGAGGRARGASRARRGSGHDPRRADGHQWRTGADAGPIPLAVVSPSCSVRPALARRTGSRALGKLDQRQSATGRGR